MTARSSTLSHHRARVALVQRWIESHLDAELDPVVLSVVAGLSEFHFHRVFRAVTGESVMEYLRRLRLQRAASKLRLGGGSILELALEAGFSSHEAFTRAFAAQFEVSPSGYRAASRAELRASEAPAPSPDFARAEVRGAVRVLAVRHVGPYQSVGAVWRTLHGLARELGLSPLGERLGLSHDDPEVTPPARLRYDACLAIAPEATPLPPGSPARIELVSEGTFAVAVHRGPCDGLGPAYGQLVRWVLERDRELGDAPSVERYLTDGLTTPPSEAVTEISVRLA